MAENRIVDWCVTLMKNCKPYGKKHLLDPLTADLPGGRTTQCGIVIDDEWFVYKSDMSAKTWSFVGCKRCQASRYPNCI